MKTISVSGKTVEEALRTGLTELNVSREQVDYIEIQAPKKGFLNLFAKPAIIEITMKPKPVDEAYKFLQEVLDCMDADLKVEKTTGADNLPRFDVSGSEVGVVIGKRGQTLEALQYLTNLVGNRHSDKYVRIELDAENYRERRKKTLEQLAYRLAGKSKQIRRKVVLEPMNAKERKIIHQALQVDPAVKTYSDGVEPRRHIVIEPNNKGSDGVE